MHTKQTVRYIREIYTSTGNEYYYKVELLTNDSYHNLDSVYWSKPRPITRQTYYRAERNGYTCETKTINKPLADIVDFSELVRFKQLREQWKTAHQ